MAFNQTRSGKERFLHVNSKVLLYCVVCEANGGKGKLEVLSRTAYTENDGSIVNNTIVECSTCHRVFRHKIRIEQL